MNINYLEGNALEPVKSTKSVVDLIVHCVNCQGVMGSGIAKQIKKKWPIVFSEYQKYCNRTNKLELMGLAQYVKISPDLYVVNLFGQYSTGLLYVGDVAVIPADYRAVKIGFANIKLRLLDKKIAYALNMPRICCGLAHGEWAEIEKIINEVFGNTDVEINVYDYDE